jgi:hypothetical protein
MEWLTVTSMLFAATIIVIILISGGARIYIRRKFDVSEHFDAIAKATKRQQEAKRAMHNVHSR